MYKIQFYENKKWNDLKDTNGDVIDSEDYDEMIYIMNDILLSMVRESIEKMIIIDEDGGFKVGWDFKNKKKMKK